MLYRICNKDQMFYGTSLEIMEFVTDALYKGAAKQDFKLCEVRRNGKYIDKSDKLDTMITRCKTFLT